MIRENMKSMIFCAIINTMLTSEKSEQIKVISLTNLRKFGLQTLYGLLGILYI